MFAEAGFGRRLCRRKPDEALLCVLETLVGALAPNVTRSVSGSRGGPKWVSIKRDSGSLGGTYRSGHA